MEQIAIVGMAALFPGSANLDQYWQNLLAGKGCISDVPPDRFDELFYDPENAHRPDRFYSRRGGFLDEAVFEPLKFGIMPNSVSDIEPDQLISLEVASAAVSDAGGPEKMPDADRVGGPRRGCPGKNPRPGRGGRDPRRGRPDHPRRDPVLPAGPGEQPGHQHS